MTEGEEVDRDERSKRGFGCELVRRADESVEAGTDDEADMVTAHDVIETGRGYCTCRCRERRVGGSRGHADRHHCWFGFHATATPLIWGHTGTNTPPNRPCSIRTSLKPLAVIAAAVSRSRQHPSKTYRHGRRRSRCSA